MKTLMQRRIREVLVSAWLMSSMPLWAADAAHDMQAMPSMPMPAMQDSADARDPNAYSDGYTLDSGPYALPGPRQLRLADEHAFWSVLVDRLEYANGDDNSFSSYDAQAWFGRTYDRAVIKAEGSVDSGNLEDSQTELLWSHAVAPFWDAQLGARQDSGDAPDRTWLAVGVQGLAPYWFDVEATAYWGESGRAAVQLKAEYELLITQRLILQPRLEMNVYGQNDPATGAGSGLSDVTAGLRLRYEFNRQFAPYVGVEWVNLYGNTADYARTNGEDVHDTQWVAGVRFWF
jgi:copper resistance protein B